jgi:hypothetical protein
MICPGGQSGRRCGALLREDTEFTAEAIRYDQPQRRYVCVLGHSSYAGLPILKTAAQPVYRPQHRHAKLCEVCGDSYTGTPRQRYCSTPCNRVAERVRKQGKPTTGKRLSAAELKAARALPNAWQWAFTNAVMIRYPDRVRRER